MEKIVYVIEDNLDYRFLMEEALTEAGYHVECFSSAMEVLENLWNPCVLMPDLVITDLMMPGLDGISFIRKLRKIEVDKNIGVIVLSAKRSQSAIDEAFSLGCNKFLIKNGDMDSLLNEVDDFLDNNIGVAKKSHLTLLEPTEIDSDFSYVIQDEVVSIFSQKEYPIGSYLRIKRNNGLLVFCTVESCQREDYYNVIICKRSAS